MNLRHYIADGSHGLELTRLNPSTGVLLQLHNQIDSVDAIEVEILKQPCAKSYPFCRNLEQFA
jgi:hypothetical protein